MEGKSYGQLLARTLVQAISWAIVLSVTWLFTFNVMMDMLRQEMKEAIEYAAQTGVRQTVQAILHDPAVEKELWPKIKQNTKEAIEYTLTMAGHKLPAPAPQPAKK